MKILQVCSNKQNSNDINFGAFRVDNNQTLNNVRKLIVCSPLTEFVSDNRKSMLSNEGLPKIGGTFLSKAQIKSFDSFSDVYVTMADFNKIMEIVNCHVGDVYGKLKKIVGNATLITQEQVEKFIPQIEAARSKAKLLENQAKEALGLAQINK